MENKVKLEIDMTLGVAYMRLSSNPVARTIQLSETMLLDIDAMGIVVGLELLDFDEKVSADLLKKHHVHSDVADEFAKLQPTLNSYLAHVTIGTDATVTAPRNTRDLLFT